MGRPGVKQVKGDAFKCVNFVPFGSLKHNSDTEFTIVDFVILKVVKIKKIYI